MQQDVEDPPALLVPCQVDDGLQAEVAQRQHRVLVTAAAQALDHLLLGQAHLGQHLVEQVGLVLEMPVDRATGHAGGAGDLFEGGVGHAIFEEKVLGGVKDRATGFLGFFFRSAHSSWANTV
ncbi:hypothetical protein D3C76_1317180 [compost metagenome]